MVAPHNAGIAPLPRSRTIPHELEPAFSMMGGHEESESDILPFALDTEGMTAPGGGQGSLHQTLLQPSPSTGAATAAPLVLQLHSKATPPPPGGAAASAHGQAMLNIAGVSCYQERDAAVGAFIRTLQSAPQLQLQPTARGNSLPVTVGQALAQVSELTQRMQLRLQASR